LGNFAKGCHEPATTIGLLNKKGGIKVFYVNVDLFRFSKHASSLEFIKLGLQLLQGIPVVLREPALTLRRECWANVDDSFDLATGTIVL